MIKLSHLLSAAVITMLLAVSVPAQTSLTEVRDTVTNVNGTPFNGTVIITWNGFTAPSAGTTSPLSTSAKIYNGALSVLLVPTSSGTPGTYYQVVYNSNDGSVSWTEQWQVPVSATPVTLAQVRVSMTQPASGSSSSSTQGGNQYATLPIAISQITGLGADLSSINQNLSSLSTQLNSLSATVSGLGSSQSTVVFVDDETPSGTINGSNTSFTLSKTPTPAGSLALYRNGVLQSPTADYTLSGAAITFGAASIPYSGDLLAAYYRVPGTGPTASFADAETPAGTVNGSNLVFTLAAAPNPALSLKLSKNGLLLAQSVDYTLSGSTITFVNASAAPQAGDVLVASYRH
jgi:hypothetical protein